LSDESNILREKFVRRSLDSFYEFSLSSDGGSLKPNTGSLNNVEYSPHGMIDKENTIPNLGVNVEAKGQ